MGNETIPGSNEPEYPREIYEPVLAPSIDLDAYLKQELTISYFDTDGDHEMQTCYGDIKLAIDALDGITLAAKRRKAPAQEDSGDREPSDDNPSKAYPLSEEEETLIHAGDIPSPGETDYKVTIEKIEGGPHMQKKPNCAQYWKDILTP